MQRPDLLNIAFAREAARSGRAVAIRKASGLSQAEVGAGCGASHAAVSRWESGLRTPHGRAAARYGALLKSLDAARAAEMTHVSTLVAAELRRLRGGDA
jgi:transcriptional regulator with XRE-family HTH domain